MQSAEVTPHEGSYFAVLQPLDELSSGVTYEDAIISQSFKASTGDRVSGWAFFLAEAAHGEGCTYGIAESAKGQVVVRSDSGTTVATPLQRSYDRWSGGGSSGWVYWEHTFTDVTGEGQFQIEARARDAICTYSAISLDDVKTSTLGPDTTKPSTSATRSVEPNAAGWNNKDVTVKLTATDNEGGWGLKEIAYRINGGQPTTKQGDSVEVPAITAEGEYTIAYYATDNAGNVEDEQNLQVKIDKTAPTIKSTSPADKARSVPLSAKISATFLESGSGIDPSTTNTDTFKVGEWVTSYDTVSVTGEVSYDEASKTVTFTPGNPLTRNKTYQGHLDSYGPPPNVEDKAGNPPYRGNRDYEWNFSTNGKLCCGL